MKKIILFFIIIYINSIFSQNASTFFPANPAYKWHYKVIPLDTLNNPIDSLITFRVDSFTTSANLYNKNARVVLTKNGADPLLYNVPYIDTILYSFEQSTGFEYIGMTQLTLLYEFLNLFLQDTTGNLLNFIRSFEGWHSFYRFANPVNSQYTILSRDTTITIDTLVLPLRFQLLGKRFNDQTIITDLGTFNCKKFTVESRLSYLVQLPPPLPPLPVKILGFIDSIWIAPNLWILKTISPTTEVNLTFLGLGSFKIPGYKMDIHNPPLSVQDSRNLVQSFHLYQNYPNPFNPTTSIKFILYKDSKVKLKIYDVLGKEIVILIDENLQPGTYEINWNASNYSSGIYYYRLFAGDFIETKKMVLLK